MSGRVRLATGCGSALDIFQACVSSTCAFQARSTLPSCSQRFCREFRGRSPVAVEPPPAPSLFHHPKSPHSGALLPRHGDADSSFRVNQVICVLRGVGDRKLHTFDFAVEGVALRTVIRGDRRTGVLADIAAVVG